MNFIKKSRIFSKKFRKKIEDLKFNYKPKNEKEKEEINEVLMQVNDMLEYMDKIIDAFKDGTFFSEYLQTSDDAGHKNVIQEIKLMEEKINLSLFEDFFESSSPSESSSDYAKKLIASSDKNKEFAEEIKDRISDLKERIKKWVKQKKNAYETLGIIKKIIDCNKNATKYFPASIKSS